jgi:hypothetical protein
LNDKSRGACGVQKAELNEDVDSEITTEAPQAICITSGWMFTRRRSATA